MPIKVNLLPTESKVGKRTLRILRITRMLGVISLGVFIVFALGIAAFFILSSTQLNSLNTSNDSLKSQISALESSETKMVLLRDRLGKIKTIQSLPSALKNLDGINSLITPLSGNDTVNELTLSSNKISTTINFKSSSDLTAFLKSLSSSDLFKTVSLTSFSFNPASGYVVSVDITGK